MSSIQRQPSHHRAWIRFLIPLVLLVVMGSIPALVALIAPANRPGQPMSIVGDTPSNTPSATLSAPIQTANCTSTPQAQSTGTIPPGPTMGHYGSSTQAPVTAMSEPTNSIPDQEGLHLVLNENFDEPVLNTRLWNTQYRFGNTNPPEQEYYTPNALTIQNESYLRIQADKNPRGNFPYSSGLIASYNYFNFQYGYVEIRAKAPRGRGLWPALWLLAQNPASKAEIDIMEILGQEPNFVYTTIHYLGDCGIESVGAGTRGPDFSADYHTYAVDWNQDRVIWYIDGYEVFRTTEHVPHEPLFLIANLAVGGDFPGSPDQATHFPANFDINYIRVFTH